MSVLFNQVILLSESESQTTKQPMSCLETLKTTVRKDCRNVTALKFVLNIVCTYF